jgi:hypothetical protein
MIARLLFIDPPSRPNGWVHLPAGVTADDGLSASPSTGELPPVSVEPLVRRLGHDPDCLRWLDVNGDSHCNNRLGKSLATQSIIWTVAATVIRNDYSTQDRF